MARELSISYAGTTISTLLDAQIQTNRESQRGSVEFTFAVQATTESAFVSACNTVEAAFSKPYQDLVVSQGSQTLVSAKQSTNTGLDPMPSILCRTDDGNTGRSRIYQVRVDFGIPATSGTPAVGLRSARVSVAYDSSRRRTVTIAGVVTASGTNDASAQYTATVQAYCTAAITALGGAYNLVNELRAPTMTAKTLDFSLTYREIKFPEGGASDDPQIKEQLFVISRRSGGARRSQGLVGNVGGGTGNGTGAGANVLPLVVMEARYTATLDFEVTSDLEGKWSGLRSWVLGLCTSVFRGGAMALMEERPEYSYDENRIAVTLVLHGVDPQGVNVYEQRIEFTNTLEPGYIALPAWGGSPYTRAIFQGPATKTRATRIMQESVGTAGGILGGGSSQGSGMPPQGASFSWGGISTGAGGFPTFFNGFVDLGSFFGKEDDFTRSAIPGSGVFETPAPGSGGSGSGRSAKNPDKQGGVLGGKMAGWLIVPPGVVETSEPVTIGREDYELHGVRTTRAWTEQYFESIKSSSWGGGGVQTP